MIKLRKEFFNSEFKLTLGTQKDIMSKTVSIRNFYSGVIRKYIVAGGVNGKAETDQGRKQYEG